MEDKDEYKRLMDVSHTYPKIEDDDLQHKIFKKREYHASKIKKRGEMESYEELEEYRNSICNPGTRELLPQQVFLGNFINPATPYRGILVFHGTGVGKCIAKNMNVVVNGEEMTMENVWNTFKTSILRASQNEEWTRPSTILKIRTHENDKIITGQVNLIFKQKISETIVEITLRNNSKIRITNSHKLLSKFGWTNKFCVGMEIKIASGEYSEIENIRNIFYDDYVYDFEILKTHNFVCEEIICHNTCSGITIAEQMKPQIQKYQSHIYVLVPGSLLKEQWKKSLVECTGDTYLINGEDKGRAQQIALQNYKIISYRSFYRKVLGDKIKNIKFAEGTEKNKYKKNEHGEFERDFSPNRITKLDNSLIIVDEAHNLTDNSYGDALKKIIKSSVNLKVVLLTATPMKNLATDIIKMLNFIKPREKKIRRDKIFENNVGHKLKFKEGGEEYLKREARGYVSYLRGADPLTFAKRVDKGETPSGLLFTKIISCEMSKFQQTNYDMSLNIEGDTLDKHSQASSNFVYPYLENGKIVGKYGIDGIKQVINQLKINKEEFNKELQKLLGNKSKESYKHGDLITLSNKHENLSGEFLKFNNLKIFSTKFHKALGNILRLVDGDKGARTAFVYSNLVKVGIEIFSEILSVNGFLEYNDNRKYNINKNTICYFCGKTYSNHPIKDHDFGPATFLVLTGQSDDKTGDLTSDMDKIDTIKNVFNDTSNIQGGKIKLVLGSSVMNEGISLYNVKEVHILDVYYGLGRVDQVVGRAIRYCSHYKIMNKNNVYPEVDVYKYCAKSDKGISTEEKLYQKAEKKYLLIKKTERLLQEVAVDCPLNYHGNVFPEERKKYENCVEPTRPLKKGEIYCPSKCNYMKCDYKCDNDKLTEKYYKDGEYKIIDKSKLDYSTFSGSVLNNELRRIRGTIKNIFKTKYAVSLEEILDKCNVVHKTGNNEKYLVYLALDQLMPITSNDFNNFSDFVFDKYYRPGYIIFAEKYYIFQPFGYNENVSIDYRNVYKIDINKSVKLTDYLRKNNYNIKIPDTTQLYNYDREYYENRKNNKIMGIIGDTFKLYEKSPKRDELFRDQMGATCASSKSLNYLVNVGKQLNIEKLLDNVKRRDICEKIEKKLLEMEKYSNNITYIIIPYNHDKYPFPLNIFDRADYILKNIKERIPKKIRITPKKTSVSVEIAIENNFKNGEYDHVFKEHNFVLSKGMWKLKID